MGGANLGPVCQYVEREGRAVCTVCGLPGPNLGAKRRCRTPRAQAVVRRDRSVEDLRDEQARALARAEAARRFQADEVSTLLRQQTSRLPLGDAVAVVAEAVGAKRLAEYVAAWTGVDCGCPTRQAWLNAIGDRLAGWLDGQPAAIEKPEKTPEVSSPTFVKSNGPVRVAFLTPTLGMGGAERWIVTLCQEWVRTGAVVPVGVALVPGAETNERLCGELARAGVPIWGTDVPHPDSPNSRSHVMRFADHAEPLRRVAASANVLVHWGIPGVESLLRGSGFRGPVVSVAHGSGAYTKAHAKAAATGSTHFAAVSEAAALAQPLRFDRETKVIWNGISLDRVTPSADRAFLRAQYGWADDEIVVAHVGRFSPEKRPLAPFEAAAARRTIGWGPWRKRLRPVLVGDGWKRQETLDGARKLWGTVDWIRPPDHIGDIYAAIDAFVLVSPEEGMSLARIEAMAAGVPIVSTRTGEIPELERRFRKLVESVYIERRVQDPFSGKMVEVAGAIPKGPYGWEIADAVARAVSSRNRATIERARRVAWEYLSAARMAAEWGRWLREIWRGRE